MNRKETTSILCGNWFPIYAYYDTQRYIHHVASEWYSKASVFNFYWEFYMYIQYA